MKLTDFVVQKAIIPDLKATTKEDVIREMVASLKAAGTIKAEEEENCPFWFVKRNRFSEILFVPQI